MRQEENRLDKATTFYTEIQLDFDLELLNYRFQSIEKFFTGSSCLELGSAEGNMTRLLAKRFAEVTTVDGSQKLLSMIEPSHNIRKICTLFENLQLPHETFDTIVADHILEHVDSPQDVLTKIMNFCHEKTIVIIGVPNALSFHRLAATKIGMLSSPYELNPRDLILGHRRVYDLESLTVEIQKAGLNLIETGGVFFKPVSNLQISQTWDEKMRRGFFELGKDFPRNAADIFAVCSLLS